MMNFWDITLMNGKCRPIASDPMDKTRALQFILQGLYWYVDEGAAELRFSRFQTPIYLAKTF